MNETALLKLLPQNKLTSERNQNGRLSEENKQLLQDDFR